MARILFAAILVLVGLTARAQSPGQLFQQGNEAYQGGRLPEARDAYEKLRSQGYESVELYYNLGNAYYKLGAVAHAILNYERADRLRPGDDDVRHNLAIANLGITDKIEATPQLFLWDYWDSIKNALSLSAYAWLGCMCFGMSAISLSVLLLSQSFVLRKVMFIVALVSGILFLPVAGVVFAKNADQERNDAAIVMSDIVTLKNSPDEGSSDAFVLHSGVKVQVTDRVSQWLKVRLADGKVGWMHADALELI